VSLMVACAHLISQRFQTSLILMHLGEIPTVKSTNECTGHSRIRAYKRVATNLSCDISPCGGGLEYLPSSLASHKRRQKGNPVPGGITGPPCSWEIYIWGPGPPG
jgi:hypothetical protein